MLNILRILPVHYPLFIVVFLGVSMFSQCEPSIDYNSLSPINAARNVQMVVEIPAGTNAKMEYNKSTQTFEQDTENGIPRRIDFLPYPGNYGYIPGTSMQVEEGGDGDALDILVIGEHTPVGTVLEVKPIGILLLKDQEELDHKIIAIPADESQRTLNAAGFMDFMMNYDGARKIIEDWFMNYKGWGKMELIGWENEKYALREIKKWTIN